MTKKISDLITGRLSLYLRCLNELAAAGVTNISSEELARRFRLNSAQIRKDLANFGEFGVRGVGYSVPDLRRDLTRILGLDHEHRIAIVGVGSLGTALANYYGFLKANFIVVGLFDADPRKIGKKVGDIEIFDIKSFAAAAKRVNIDVAVIAVPPAEAQSAVDIVTGSGVKAVMNFAPAPLSVSSDVKLKTIDLTTTLECLSYFLSEAEAQNGSNLKPNPGSRRN